MSLLENIAAKIERAREAIPSGQERTAWLRRQEEAVGNAIRPYVPPELRGTNALAALAEFSDAADMRDYYTTGGEAANALMQGDMGRFAETAPLAAASGIAAMLPGLSLGPMDNVVRAADDGGSGGIRAYHGSPHDFDRFQMDRIGTGEGAQAYGHGLYFAENEKVAKGYRDTLSRNDIFRNMTFDGDPVDFAPNGTSTMLKEAYPLVQETGSVDAAISLLRERAESSPLTYQRMRSADIADFLEGNASRIDYYPSGRMYEVNINASPDEFLDWDAPLSEQPKRVRQWFDSRGITPGFAGRQSGAELFQAERRALGDDELAKSLREAGIPGVRYLDHGSRFNAADGLGPQTNTRNYVVFDDNIIDIIRKYGLAGVIGGGAAAGYGYETDREGNPQPGMAY